MSASERATVPVRDASAMFATARRLRSFEDVVSQIRDAIVGGTLVPGDRLPNERDLCTTFAVSRGTLREALRTLEALGAIEIRPGSAGGIFIAEPSGERLATALESLLQLRGASDRELIEFGGSLFAETAYWAAVRADDEELASLAALGRETEALALDPAGRNRLLDLHESLVATLAAGSKNTLRQALVLALRPALTHALPGMRPPLSPPAGNVLAGDIRAIVDAVCTRNARVARVAMRRHVQKLALSSDDAPVHR